MNCSTPVSSVLHHLMEFAQTHAHWVSDATQPSHPLPPPSVAFSLSQHQDLSQESALHIQWPKYWSFSYSNSPSNEYSGLVSFRVDWVDLLVVQGTLKSLLQHPNCKASVLWHSAFFMSQLSHCTWLLEKHNSVNSINSFSHYASWDESFPNPSVFMPGKSYPPWPLQISFH